MVKRSFAWLIAVGLAVGCAGPGKDLSTGPNPDQARLQAERESNSAYAAELLWLVANDRESALKRLDAGLVQSPDDPRLLLRRALILRERLDTNASQRDLLALIASRPRAPESTVALGILLDDMPERPEALQDLTAALHSSELFEVPAPERGVQVVAAAALVAAMAHHHDNPKELEAARARGGFLTTARVLGPIAPLDDFVFETERSIERQQTWESPGSFRGQPIPVRSLDAQTFRLRPALPERTGLHVIESYVDLLPSAAETPVDLVAQLPSSARVLVNGVTVIERDLQQGRGPALHRARLRMNPGRHRLVLSILATRATAPFIALIGADGRPVVASSRIGTPPPKREDARFERMKEPPLPVHALVTRLLADTDRAPFGRWLGAQIATGAWHRDLDRARALSEALLQEYPHSAAGWTLRAKVLGHMKLPAALAATALRRAVEEDPTAPRALLGLAGSLVSQDPTEALELTSRARAAAPRAPEPEQMAFRLFRERGWRAEAVGALTAAVDKGASAHWLLSGARYLRGLERHHQANDLTMRALKRAPQLAPMIHFESALRALTPPSEARTHLKGENDPASKLRVAEVALADGDLELAHSIATERIRRNPHDARARSLLLRIAALRNDTTAFAAAMAELRQRGQASVELEAQSGLVGMRPRWEPTPGSWLDKTLAFDPWPHVVSQERDRLPPGIDPADRWAGHSQVILLDRVVDRVNVDGSVLSLRHRVTRLQTKEATDEAGEVRLPSGALALSLKTLKSDGRSLDVDRHAGKDDVSFSALAPGDAVEEKFVQTESPRTPWGGYLRTFYFRTPSPMIRSEFVVTVPRGATVWTHRYHGAPEPEIRKENDETIYLWQATQIPSLHAEPFAPAPEEYLPHVVIAVDLDRATAERANVRPLHRAARPGPRIARIARQLTRNLDSDEARARALYDYVDQRVDFGPATDPVTVLEARRGDATGLFVALLRAAQVDASVVMVRPGHRAWAVPAPPNPAAFSRTAARITLNDGRILWATFDRSGSWLGGLAPRARGARYLAVEGTQIVQRPVPDPEIETWLLESSVDFTIDEAGTARGELTLILPGRRKDGLSRFLKQSRQRDVERLMQGWLSNVLPGARLVEVSNSGLERRSDPLTVHVRVNIPHFMTTDNGHLVVEELLVNALAQRAVGLPELSRYLAKPRRQTPLLLVPVEERMTVTLRLPSAVTQLVERPQTFARSSKHGVFEQTFTWDPQTRVARWERLDHLPLARVAQSEFEDFRNRLEEVIQLGDNRIVARMNKATAQR